jgi:hypothetical protein
MQVQQNPSQLQFTADKLNAGLLLVTHMYLQATSSRNEEQIPKLTCSVLGILVTHLGEEKDDMLRV